MHRASHVVLLPVALLLLSLVASPVAAATPPPLPASMAALGDSITRAYDVCCAYSDHPGVGSAVHLPRPELHARGVGYRFDG
jgi:hypothetical protein